MKKILTLLLALIMGVSTATFFVGCINNGSENSSSTEQVDLFYEYLKEVGLGDMIDTLEQLGEPALDDKQDTYHHRGYNCEREQILSNLPQIAYDAGFTYDEQGAQTTLQDAFMQTEAYGGGDYARYDLFNADGLWVYIDWNYNQGDGYGTIFVGYPSSDK